MTLDHPLLRTAITAVTHACRVARIIQADSRRGWQLTKDDRSPVTVADFAVQAIIAMELTDALGETLIVGEETADALRLDDHSALLEAVVSAVREYRPQVEAPEVLAAIDAGNHDATAESYWVLDPIDGTKGFLRGQQYAVALAHLASGRVDLGVMGCPNLSLDHSRPLDAADPHGSIYTAVRGGGASETPADDPSAAPRPIRRDPTGPAEPIRLCASVEAAHSKHRDVERVVERLGGLIEYARLDSQSKYALVARGQADAYLRLPTRKAYVEKIWDQAAGMLIATEAGAVVTDITGAPLDFSHGPRLEANRGIVCARADLHGRIIEAIEDLGIAAAV